MIRALSIQRIARAGAILLGMASAGLSDTITLKDGTQLEGSIEMETPQKIALKQGGGIKLIARSDIASVTKSAPADNDSPAAQPAPRPANPRRAAAPAVLADTQNDPIAGVVVKVNSTLVAPDFLKPWTRLAPQTRTGSGYLLGNGRVLTNSHLVMHASQVQVQANESGDKISASVVALAPDLDLAILKLDEKSPMDTPAAVADCAVLPEIKDTVSVYGFPEEGSNVSITTATVTRIDFASSGRSYTGLHVWLNTTVNVGLTGGPVIYKNQFLGIAVSYKSGDQPVTFIVPYEEVEGFLKALTPKGYPGKPVIVQEFQKIANPALRSFLNLPPEMHGMLVNEADLAFGSSQFKDWDVVTQVGDKRVDNEGMVPFTNGSRIAFAYMIQKATVDGHVAFKVMRAGKEVPLSVPVTGKRPTVYRDLVAAYPSYFILGPVVFSSATKQLFAVIDNLPNLEAMLGYRGSPLVKRRAEKPAFEGEELVIVSSPFFPHKLVEGYSDSSLCVVKSVNGVAIRNLLHLVEVLRDLKDEFIVIEFGDRYCENLVFPRAEMLSSTESILNDNDVRSQGSADTMAVWNAKAAGH